MTTTKNPAAPKPTVVYTDGGRAAAGFKGETGDCGVRAIAIATEMDYRLAYEIVNVHAKDERQTSRMRRGRSSARTGIHAKTMRVIMAALGWDWVATMGIGTGCRVHLRADELPAGRIIARVSKHYVAVVDGVVHDNHDSTREGTRCVYGYWTRSAADA